MTRTIVGVLRGGASSEYDLSLKTGSAVMQALPEDAYAIRDILIDKSGAWNVQGRSMDPVRALQGIDVVFNALHGNTGEDGKVVRILERAGVPYTGGRPHGLRNSLNKITTRQLLQKEGIRMPRSVSFSAVEDLTTADLARLVFNTFGPPYVVKPVSGSFSSGVRFVSSLPELPDALGDVLDDHEMVVVEEFVQGKEISVGVIDNFRDIDVYALSPAEVMCTDEGVCITGRAWREGMLNMTCPTPSLSSEHKEQATEIAQKAHQALGLSGYSSVDFISTPRGVYVLEVDALPGLYQGAPFPVMLEGVGSSVPEFIEHAIAQARRGY